MEINKPTKYQENRRWSSRGATEVCLFLLEIAQSLCLGQRFLRHSEETQHKNLDIPESLSYDERFTQLTVSVHSQIRNTWASFLALAYPHRAAPLSLQNLPQFTTDEWLWDGPSALRASESRGTRWNVTETSHRRPRRAKLTQKQHLECFDDTWEAMFALVVMHECE